MVGFWHVALYHTRQVEPTFRLFHFRKRILPNGIGLMPRFMGQKLGIFQETFMRRASSVWLMPSSFMRRRMRRRKAEAIWSIVVKRI